MPICQRIFHALAIWQSFDAFRRAQGTRVCGILLFLVPNLLLIPIHSIPWLWMSTPCGVCVEEGREGERKVLQHCPNAGI